MIHTVFLRFTIKKGDFQSNINVFAKKNTFNDKKSLEFFFKNE